jgi:hypothetical protein
MHRARRAETAETVVTEATEVTDHGVLLKAPGRASIENV